MGNYARFLILFLLSSILYGCATLGIDIPYRNDPLTGGIDVSSSELLNIKLPAGLQRYPSHGFINVGENGEKEGLETFRGNINGVSANMALFDALHQANWQLLLSLRKGDRSIAIYGKDAKLALIALHRQGMLTILEIWAGRRLPEGSSLRLEQENYGDAEKSFAPEEYGPLDGNSSDDKPGTVERWGGKLEEREL